MNVGVLAGLAKGRSSFTLTAPSITTNFQFLSDVAPGDPFFNSVTLLLSENSQTSKEFQFGPFDANRGSKLNSNGAINTYSLVYTTANAYVGAVIDNLGDIHFVPRSGTIGQKVSSDGVVSTYNYVYTVNGAYSGGVLLPGTGEAHFIPFTAAVGQKITSSGTVSTYSLLYTTGGAYNFGVIAPNGDLHFVPFRAAVGQKISSSGTLSTYSLVYTSSSDSYAGGAVAPNGDIHFIPRSAPVGQKVGPDGTVSTYSLVFTGTNAYFGGVLAANGDIHFVPSAGGNPPSLSTLVGQKIGSDTIVSTYSLPYTTTNAYVGGVLLENGDLHFVPLSAAVGTKISSTGTVSTYSLAYTTALGYSGGALSNNIVNNNVFLDSGPNAVTVYRTGNVTQGTFTPYGSSWSVYFDGTNDALEIANTATLQPGTSNFTIEAWIYRASTGTAHTICAKGGLSTGFVFQVTSGNVLRFVNGFANIDSIGTIAANQWVHVAAVREGTGTNQCKMYINGINDGTGTVTSDYNQTNVFRVGEDRANNDDFRGYISNLRYTIGAALYTGNFTPSTSPLTTTSQGATTSTVQLLMCQSNRFNDASTNNFSVGPAALGNPSGSVTPTITKFSPFGLTTAYLANTFAGSAYFDTSGDYLTTPSISAFGFGTGDFTIDGWIYPLSWNASNNVIIDFRSGTEPSIKPDLEVSSGGTLFYLVNGSNVINGSNGAVRINSWHHIALSRASGTTRLFLNGVQQGSNYSDTNNYGTSSRCQIGADDDGSPNAYFNGYMSNVRVIKGTAIYTTAFTPPTTPVTATTTTSLLLNFTNGGIIDSSMNNNLETLGNARLNNVQKKWTNRSIFFDGTGDYLTAPNNSIYSFGTGDFTVEAWVYVAASKAQVIWDSRASGPSTAGIAFAIDASNRPYVYVNGATLFTSSTGLTLNTWTHLAFVKSSGTITLYINGTKPATGSAASSTSLTDQACTVGTAVDYRDTSATLHFNGYIDDLRITKGVARYTADFTVPTSAFPRYSA